MGRPLRSDGGVRDPKLSGMPDWLLSGFDGESYHCLSDLKTGGIANSHHPSAEAGAEHIKPKISTIFIRRCMDLSTSYSSATRHSDSSFGDGLWQSTLSAVR